MRLFLFVPLLLSAVYGQCQTKTISYVESQEDFPNPERGFYLPAGTRAGHFIPLDKDKLIHFRNEPQQPGRASYAIKATLILRNYELDGLNHQPLPDSLLNRIQNDFNVIRSAGLKMILRFSYIDKTHSGDCPDEYHICPPYGDAPEAIMLEHIRQLKPLLQRNADVIAVMQEGFIGVWGENFYTDYFGDASANGPGRIMDSSWEKRAVLLKALLDALPSSRMIQVRTPQIKQKFVYGPHAPSSSAPLSAHQAYTGSAAARIGFHNDCFLASADDYGTYNDYGSSVQPKTPANEVMRKYIEADTKYTVVGGETCDDAFSPQNDCAPAGHAEEEMRSMHYSFLNAAYNTSVNNDWDSAGCMSSIKKKLGYRFVLQKMRVPETVKADMAFPVELEIDNIGYASPYNPRPVYLVFVNGGTGKSFQVRLKANPQQWFSGLHIIQEQVQLPAGTAPGGYRLYLSLPDASPSISSRPEYAIRLANEKVWEASTGYNDLHCTVVVK
ncbi:MAG TPA: DUF4832 domain-containing protein [Puia sp.]|nr:DUF4832 domain-containing protein [Puia sp.]